MNSINDFIVVNTGYNEDFYRHQTTKVYKAGGYDCSHKKRRAEDDWGRQI